MKQGANARKVQKDRDTITKLVTICKSINFNNFSVWKKGEMAMDFTVENFSSQIFKFFSWNSARIWNCFVVYNISPGN